MKVELLSYTPNGEKLIERAGRVCHASEPKGNPGKFIKKLIEIGHESVIEHTTASFEISEISRACSHQIVRSRLASFSQRSQRYCAEERWSPVIPNSIENNKIAWGVFERTIFSIRQAYAQLRGLGIPKEDARFILPNATPTKMVMSANLREWRHIINTRCDKSAQWEIRAVATEILKQLHEVFPNVFDDLYKKFI